MSSATRVLLELVRAHYHENEDAFASHAGTLARAMAKDRATQSALFDTLRAGIPRAQQRAESRRQNQQRADQGQNPQDASGGPKHPSLATESSLLEKLAPVRFADLLLPDDIQAELDEVALELEYRGQLSARGLAPRARLLFHGTPGNGKSSCAAALASTIGAEGFCVSIAELSSMFVGGTGSNLSTLFQAMRPTRLIVFDELDAIGAERSGSDGSGASREQNAVVNTLLTLLDRKTPGVLVATTNRLDILDPALVRRFDAQIYFPDPTNQQKLALAERLCEGWKVDVPTVEVLAAANYDKVHKLCMAHARRRVMAEILKQGEQYGSEERQDAQG
jgi:SpoVK/Ycf46/Vps4 family AAA+-type ATPase